MNKKIIYLDIDGVLTNFVGDASDVCGCSRNCYYENAPEHQWEIWKFLIPRISEEEFWNRIEAKGTTFWAFMSEYAWKNRLIKLCESYGKVVLLTSPAPSNYAYGGRLLYIKYDLSSFYAGKNFILTPKKELLAQPNAVLIDDSGIQIKNFVKNGGTGIEFPQLWNHGGEEFRDILSHEAINKRLELVDTLLKAWEKRIKA